jgi:hypothetical protein
MKAVSGLCLLICTLLIFLPPAQANAGTRDDNPHRLAVLGAGSLLNSTGTGISAKAATDTFYIYGGPGTAEGRFQTLVESPGGAPTAQGWIGVDLTEQTPKWHASTINAESVADGNPKGFTGGVGNYAAISHHESTGPNDYSGYGNAWDDWLVFTYDVSAGDPGFDPAMDSTPVRFSAQFKYDLEECCDFIHFEWNRAGAYQTLLALDGTSYNDSTGYYEARSFDSDDWGGVVYNPGDYVGGNSIQLRVRVTSDSGWSDEDGLYTTNGRGAVALDNITVYVGGAVVSVADFEPLGMKTDLPEGDFTGHDVGAGAGTDGWQPVPSTFVGDFSKIFAQFQDIDPCRDNVTPQFTFINDGTPPNNCPTCPIAPSISATWTYGIPGGYVVDYNGGLTNGVGSLANEIWSPPFAWDLPGTEDDVANGGAWIGFTSWLHLPRPNSIFAVWHVRSFDGEDWSGWEDNNFVYYSNVAAYSNWAGPVTDKLVQDPVLVQIALGVLDLADAWSEPGDDATPAPNFDNVYFKKYVIGGPVISTRVIDLASDCFPIDGTLTGSCRFDANINLDYPPVALVPGDSIVAEIKAIIPGTTLADPVHGGNLVVRHLVNPAFAAQRAAGMAQVGGAVVGVDPQTGWDVYEYTVAGSQVTNASGDPIADRFFWDLPDGFTNGLPQNPTENALFFPADVVHYYLESSDDLGNLTTLPEDLSAFGDFTEGNLYFRIFVVRFLPTIVDGGQPGILFWNDWENRDEEECLQAFRQNGLVEGVDYDTYTTKAAGSGGGGGLGSAGFHGANAAQLAGYDCMVYRCGITKGNTISDGTGTAGNDVGNDLGTVEAWANADADRFHVYFGDSFAEAMVGQGAACQSYLNNGLGVDLLSVDVGPRIDHQTAATIKPTGDGSGSYVSNYVAYGGCLAINDFDQIGAFGVGPTVTHGFTQSNATQYPDVVAGSIEWLRTDGNGNTKHTIVFPYDLSFVRDILVTNGTGISARAVLLGEIFASWGKAVGGPGIGTSDLPKQLVVNQNYPNPFNPRTTIKFAMPARGQVSVKVYNVRGELVTTLFDGVKDAGEQTVIWSGQDSNGSQVSTGIYLYKVQAAGTEVVKKMALIK